MPGPESLTAFPNGISSFGVPVLGSGPTIPVTTGKYFYVHHTGSAGNAGTSPLRPISSITRALTKCVSNRGDVIILMPGHTEAVTAASGINLNVNGVYIVGLGWGLNRPTINFTTAATATIAVAANNLVLDNIQFVAGFADIVAPLTIGAADDVVVRRCLFRASAADLNFLHVFDTGTTDASCDGLTFVDNEWFEVDAATLAFGLVDCAIDRLNISRNLIVNGAATADVAALLTIATGKNLTNARIMHNNLDITGNAGSTAGIFITTDGTAHSGIIAYNNIKHLDATTEILITATATFGLFENRMTAVHDAQGFLRPAVDS